MKFEVGDRVRCLVDRPIDIDIMTGQLGTVCYSTSYNVGVEWDGCTTGHDCGGACPDGRGWFVCPEFIEHVYEECDDDFTVSPSDFDALCSM